MKFQPRPDFAIENLVSLDGEWRFALDYEDKWHRAGKLCGEYPHTILVPYVYQCERSGVPEKGRCDYLWYEREFLLGDCPKAERIFLVFGACDYYTEVYLNGRLLGVHTGGYTPFRFEITRLRRKNTLTVYVRDPFERDMPRGKQHLGEKADRCWYLASSGIWQSVYLEGRGEYFLRRAHAIPSIKTRTVSYEAELNGFCEGLELLAECSYHGKTVCRNVYSVPDRIFRFTVDLREEDYVDEVHYWSAEHPNLYDVKFTLLLNGRAVDKVGSYFGMREIEVRNGDILLNNNSLYQRTVLDQGYFAQTLLTPPDDETLKRDIELIKSFGYNGVRMHQKIEDPRFYYYADVLGLYVWGELPSAYGFCEAEQHALVRDFEEFIDRDYNHPSIICWVPLNESWGTRNIRYDVRQQNFARALYYLAKSKDPTRLVTMNDGWEVVGGDFIALHSYEQGERLDRLFHAECREKSAIQRRICLADGVSEEGRPVLLTEFGGFAYAGGEGWGYGRGCESEEELLARLERVMRRLYAHDEIKGFCYTQYSDVFQEINGHVTLERKIKIAPERVRKLIRGEFDEKDD